MSNAQLCIAFYELRKKAAWFGSKDERLYWEQWCGRLNSHM
jgi:hypothetical protein